ncbi:hypothetical protein HY485_05145 [Candidatus Woesearchaeota archaeon]|nr:hypothetical protein [Candidatus Woesearchaeota archaeon]
MSFVTLIIVKNKQLTVTTAHYTFVKKVIEHGLVDVVPLKTNNHHRLDAGYVLIDYDAKTIVNAQDAFAIRNLENFQIVMA